MPWGPRPERTVTVTVRVEARCSCGAAASMTPASDASEDIELARQKVAEALGLDHVC